MSDLKAQLTQRDEVIERLHSDVKRLQREMTSSALASADSARDSDGANIRAEMQLMQERSDDLSKEVMLVTSLNDNDVHHGAMIINEHM